MVASGLTSLRLPIWSKTVRVVANSVLPHRTRGLARATRLSTGSWVTYSFKTTIQSMITLTHEWDLSRQEDLVQHLQPQKATIQEN